MRRFGAALLAGLAGLLATAGGQAFAAGSTSYVGSCGGKSTPSFASVQAAVDAVTAAGSTIRVCPGTYTEQVTIPATVPAGLTIQATQHWGATVKAPASMAEPKAIVRVNGAQDVKLTDLVVSGPGGGGCDSLRWGIRVDGNGSATIAGDHITHIRDEPSTGCLNGVAVLVGFPPGSAAGRADVKANTIDDYQFEGVTVANPGSVAKVTGNTITGVGATDVLPQNGVDITSGAAATVSQNTITANVFTPQFFTSTGILVFGPVGPTSVSQNVLTGDDTGVYLVLTDSGSTVSGNTISGGALEGISLGGVTGSVVADNTISHEYDGIGLYGVTGATLRGNSATASFPGDGYYVSPESTGNVFRGNTASGSFELDCWDASIGAGSFGTASTWPPATYSNANHGTTSDPAGLCTPGAGASSPLTPLGLRPLRAAHRALPPPLTG